MSQPVAPAILVIIVTWNKKQYVLDLLSSLANMDYPNAALTVLVVDNASEDGTVEAIAQAHPSVTVVRNAENLGGTGGFNTGLHWAFQQAQGQFKYLWLLDNDVLVHRRALAELVAVLETQPDIAVAGSTMMQLDYPYRINEMGAFFNRANGQLILNRHHETIPHWQGRRVQELLSADPNLPQYLLHCHPYMDVDYVAAASLLIRADVAKLAGLWRDFFIHYDDVEWCLRIASGLRQRVVVSANSLIWHLSAAAKVPTWVLYYDNRNVLVTLQHHGFDPSVLQRAIRYIYKKAVYYALLGKADLSRLHHDAVVDFHANQLGKKTIRLEAQYQPNRNIAAVFLDPTVRRILIPWPVNLQATQIQQALVQAMRQRPELQVDYLAEPGQAWLQWPRAHFITLPSCRLRRAWFYWRLRGRYDMVLQSDYRALIPLAWLGARLLYINDEGFCLRVAPKIADVAQSLTWWWRAR